MNTNYADVHHYTHRSIKPPTSKFILKNRAECVMHLRQKVNTPYTYVVKVVITLLLGNREIQTQAEITEARNIIN